jgi:magnesium-protoporphyrin IX monomethyl ester (oxidative) cyclase
MFVRDHSRPEFHKALGVGPEAYGLEVFRIVAKISEQVFPVLVDTEDPRFLRGVRRLTQLAARIDEVTRGGGRWGKLRALPLKLRAGVTFLRLYFLPVKQNPLPSELRVAPTW